LKDDAQTALFKYSVRTAQQTLFFSVIKANKLALYRTYVAMCSEINTKHTNTVWQNVKFLHVKPVGSSHNQYALTGFNRLSHL